MALKIDMLRVFRAVAETGSLAHASEQLRRTPSAISMTLKQLEQHLGVALFESQRKSHLTPMGRHVLAEAQRELAHFDSTVSRIEQLAKAEAGLVRLAVTPSFAQVFLPDICARFRERFPKVRLELRDTDSASVLSSISRDAADIAVATLPERPGYVRSVLFSDPFGVVCAADHPLVADWDALTWRDLAGTPLIANGLCGQITDPAFAPLLAASHLMVHSTASLLALVRAGQGITVLPKLVMPPGDAGLAFLPLRDTTAQRQVHLMHKDEAALLPPVRAFIAALREGCADKLQQN